MTKPRPPRDAQARYVGRRVNGEPRVIITTPRGGIVLSPRFDLRDHSPTGFEWGYHGSGPAQLALAIVADATGDDALAVAVYQRFKDEIVATLPRHAVWELGAGEVAEFARLCQPVGT